MPPYTTVCTVVGRDFHIPPESGDPANGGPDAALHVLFGGGVSDPALHPYRQSYRTRYRTTTSPSAGAFTRNSMLCASVFSNSCDCVMTCQFSQR